VSGIGGEVRADGEAHEIVDVRHREGFVEVVDTPDEASVDVAPGAEIFNVQIANREQMWSFGQIGADLGPDLRPAIVSGSQERKDSGFHIRVLEAEVFLGEVGAVGEPVFELTGGFDYVHRAETIVRSWREVNAGIGCAMNSGVCAAGHSVAGGPPFR
jgi:hypothetical protein